MPSSLQALSLAALWLGLSVGATNARGAATGLTAPPPLSSAAAWSTTYLLNTVFSVEYASVHEHPSGNPAAAPFEWTRAYFALASMRAKGQNVPAASTLTATLAADPATRVHTAAATALEAAAESAVADRGEAAVQTGFTRLAATFPAKEWAERWEHLAAAYSLPPPTCPLDYAEVRRYAALQRQQLAGGQGVNGTALLAPVAGWSATKVQCLATALMQGPAANDSGFDPLPLLTAVMASGSPLAHDASLMALFAARLLVAERYAEALHVLLELADYDDSYRLPYELVQRTYSYRQRGSGNVGLQSL